MSQEIKNKINKALKEIRPFLNFDGGDIELIGIDKEIAKVRFLGNCSNCSIKETTKAIIERIIKDNVKEITKVIHVNSNE
jgi:Fe-S cluster biogenesis protein NfuA